MDTNCFFEDRCRHCCPQLILERNHVVFLAFLFSCQRTDLAKGRLDCQTLPSVSSGMFPCSQRRFCLAREPIPVDPDTGTTLVLLGLERSNCLLRRDRGVYVPLRRLSIIASGTFITRDRPSLFQPLARSSKIQAFAAGTRANARRCLPIPSQPCTNGCACCGYRSVVRELRSPFGTRDNGR